MSNALKAIVQSYRISYLLEMFGIQPAQVGYAWNPGLSKLCRILRLHSTSPFVFQLLTSGNSNSRKLFGSWLAYCPT